jgi:hypothetical protein
MCGTFDTKTHGIQKWIDQDNIDIALMKIQQHRTLSIHYSSQYTLHFTPLRKVLTSLGVLRISIKFGKFGASVAGISLNIGVCL